jgi:hypothetical protein
MRRQLVNRSDARAAYDNGDPEPLLGVRVRVSDVVGFGELGRVRVSDVVNHRRRRVCGRLTPDPGVCRSTVAGAYRSPRSRPVPRRRCVRRLGRLPVRYKANPSALSVDRCHEAGWKVVVSLCQKLA